MSENTKFAVIGATGRLGFEVVRNLLDRGYPTIAVVRNADKATRLFAQLHADKGPSVRTADLTKRETLAPAIEGANYVIHAAGGFAPIGLFSRLPLH